MTYLLDTSITVEILRARNRSAVQAFEGRAGECALCEIVVAELLFGCVKYPHRSKEPETRRFIANLAVLPFSLPGAEAYARIRTDLERTGNRIGANDLLIAATALAHGATLVTRNVGEFSRVAGLAVESWSA